MAKLSAAMAHWQLPRHPECGQCFGFKSLRLDRIRFRGVVLHVHQRGGKVFRRTETLVKGCRFLDLCNQAGRYWLAAAVVDKVAFDNLVGR